MKTATFTCLWPPHACLRYPNRWLGVVGAALLLFGSIANLRAMPVVETLTDIPYLTYPNYYGFVNGNTLYAQFHTPYGIAVDSTGQFLFVADRDNNAIRELKLGLNQTLTFVPNPVAPTNLLNKPVGVALDGAGNVYVLNRGNGNNGMVLEFDKYGGLLATNATALTNAAGIALDRIGNIYVTVQSNTLIRITPSGTKINIATITSANTSLQGIIVKHDGRIAACDSGNNGIWLIDPATGAATKLTGFNGAGDYTGLNNQGATSATAKFNQPYGVTEAGDGSLVVTDYGNHRVKVVQTSGVVTNLYGVSSNFWYGPLCPSQDVFPGWWDGTVVVPDALGDVEARLPLGVVFAPDGTVYTTEVYYHVIREITGAGLPLPPPPPPQVAAPQIGWVDFPYPKFLSLLHPGTSFVFNNDVIIAIKGEAGSQVFYTSGPRPAVGTIQDPSPTNGSTPPYYADNLPQSSVTDLGVTRYPDMLIRAIGTKNDGSPSSAIVEARFQFIAATPIIQGDNAASFVVSNITAGVQMWYTLNGVDPTNITSSTNFGPILNGTTLSLDLSGSNITFKIRAFRDNYQPSGVVSNSFSTANFNANKISFGFDSGEASSEFIASAGQFFYAPVTLSVLPGTTMYSLQFNVTATNINYAPALAPAPGYVGFKSMLMEKLDTVGNVDVYREIPPGMLSPDVNPPPPDRVLYRTDEGYVVDTTLMNTALNLLGLGWLERIGKTNLYNTTKQDLITYSMAHDTVFPKAGGKVVVGGYAFRVPGTATNDQQYRIAIGRPSATSDGVGAPGSDVFIDTPMNGSLTNGAINSIKLVTVGQRKYIAGDVYPFRWFNAGDFGNLPPTKCPPIINADVMQVFQSAVYKINKPPAGSDFEDAMNSCCGVYTDTGVGYLTLDPSATAAGNLFDGNDTNINTIAFGTSSSGETLDVTDVYVTFRRSLDPSLVNFYRFWTNNGSGGVLGASFAPNANCTNPVPVPAPAASAKSISGVAPAVSFSATDIIGSAGQQVQIPITARIQGSYPIRVLMLNLTVQPLDGSPAITSGVQFRSPLGTPTTTASKGSGNYAAAWLNKSVALSGSNVYVGTLTFTVPASAPGNAAYAIHFDHASASPNGIASFPKQTRTGLITLSNRSASSWNDGIPDSWRLRYFGSINNILSAASADADGDGMSNLQEYKAGTDPNDSSSRLKLNSSRNAGAASDFVVRWPSVAGKNYIVEIAPTLYGSSWIPVSTNSGTGWDIEYHDSSASGGARFYRVRLLQ